MHHARAYSTALLLYRLSAQVCNRRYVHLPIRDNHVDGYGLGNHSMGCLTPLCVLIFELDVVNSARMFAFYGTALCIGDKLGHRSLSLNTFNHLRTG
jgi:hypothetical protein